MDTSERIKLINGSDDFSALASHLSELDIKQLKTRYISSISRTINNMNKTADIKIAYMSNFVMDLLPSFIDVYTARENLRCTSYIGPYNQYYQEILNGTSGLKQFKPDIIFLCLALRNLEPEALYQLSSLNESDRRALTKKIIEDLQQWSNVAIERFPASILVSNFPSPAYTQNGIADSNDTFGEMQFYQVLNRQLNDLARRNTRIHIFDMAKLMSRVGWINGYDPKMFYMAKLYMSDELLKAVSEEILRWCIALKGLTRKCLVLDLDNTLWGGIIGEDGTLGVKIGQGEPASEAYLDFQHKIKSLKDRGVMLAICSKNNEEDVMEVFNKRQEMPLKMCDFAAHRINWDSKHLNIQQLSDELNIGLDSMVFLDDNPAECSLVRQMLPEVKTIQVPKNPEAIPGIIDDLVVFEKSIILEEDRTKTVQYHQNRERKHFKSASDDLTSYLCSLNTAISIKVPLKEDLSRVHQLFTKTNQFNVTTIRYSIGQIEEFLKKDSHQIYIVSARDRFGDLGIIGLCLLDKQDQSTKIDSFILSCRAMGRGIEIAIMNFIKQVSFGKEKCDELIAEYVPTQKNKPVKRFFDEQGFDLLEEVKKGGRKYRLTSINSKNIDCDWIKLAKVEG